MKHSPPLLIEAMDEIQQIAQPREASNGLCV